MRLARSGKRGLLLRSAAAGGLCLATVAGLWILGDHTFYRTTRWDQALRNAAAAYMPAGWDWMILKALVAQESRFAPAARSRRGAEGLGQLMPATRRELASRMGRDPASLLEPETNILASACYLRWCYDRWPAAADQPPLRLRTRLALACYNAGATRVRAVVARGDEPWTPIAAGLPAETSRYVERILEVHYPRFRSAAGTDPDPRTQTGTRQEQTYDEPHR